MLLGDSVWSAPGITAPIDEPVGPARRDRFADMAVVEFERRDHIALLTLNRPEARNAINPEVSQTMAGLLDEIEADRRAPCRRRDRATARCSARAPT